MQLFRAFCLLPRIPRSLFLTPPRICRNIQITKLHYSPEADVITIAQWKVAVCGIYLAIGLVFAVVFLSVGLQRLDAAAKGASIGFRLLILPGVVALWPYLLKRWMRGERAPRPERNAHRDRAQEAIR